MRDAQQLLDRLSLPPGATQLSSEPSGDGGVLSRPPASSATPNQIDQHRWWRADGSPDSVLSYVKAHPPDGSRLEMNGTGAGPGYSYQYLGFSWPPVDNRLGTRWLLVEVTALPDGATGVRSDAEVVWIPPRLPTEKVPPGVRTIDIRRTSPPLSLRISNPWKVRQIVRLVNQLPVAQPGAIACPALVAGRPVVSFRFMSASGLNLAAASEHADVAEPTTPCDPLFFSVRSHSETPLLRGAEFLHRVDRLLGVTLATQR
jgi:hypothetical protein